MMTTDATRLRQFRSLAEVDIDALIRDAHIQRNRLIAAHVVAAVRAFRRAVLGRFGLGSAAMPGDLPAPSATN